jgi:trans-aconitate methyltransferase
MTDEHATGIPWSEADSQHFIERGRIHIPNRDEIGDTILDLIPAEPDEPFQAVELGVGAGWLCEAILRRFPSSRVIGLDGSPAMLREATTRLQPFAGRFELRSFRLEDDAWHTALGNDVRCFVSSLVVHHLSSDGKRQLYRDVYAHLEPGGAVLIADLVAPCSERQRRFMARSWDAEVRRQSLAFTGSLDAFEEFVRDASNWFDYPDPMDIPSSIPDHLTWLADAGFTATDVFWARAGHALYGGYRPS